MPEITVDYLSVILKLIMSVVVVAVTWIACRVVQDVIKRRIRDTAHKDYQQPAVIQQDRKGRNGPYVNPAWLRPIQSLVIGYT